MNNMKTILEFLQSKHIENTLEDDNFKVYNYEVNKKYNPFTPKFIDNDKWYILHIQCDDFHIAENRYADDNSFNSIFPKKGGNSKYPVWKFINEHIKTESLHRADRNTLDDCVDLGDSTYFHKLFIDDNDNKLYLTYEIGSRKSPFEIYKNCTLYVNENLLKNLYK